MKIYTYETNSGLLQDDLKSRLESILHNAEPSLVIELAQIPKGLKDALQTWEIGSCICDLIFKHLGNDSTNYRVLISTDKHSSLYKWCKKQKGLGDWGFSNEFISIDYSPVSGRSSNQLHECLHFFGVKDCYRINDKNPKLSCDCKLCVMRYGIITKKVCNHVLTQIKKWANTLN